MLAITEVLPVDTLEFTERQAGIVEIAETSGEAPDDHDVQTAMNELAAAVDEVYSEEDEALLAGTTKLKAIGGSDEFQNRNLP